MAEQIRIDLIVDDKGTVTIKNFGTLTNQVVGQVNRNLNSMKTGWQQVSTFAERAFFVIEGFRSITGVLDNLNQSATRAVSATEGLKAIAEFKGVEGAVEAVNDLDAVRSGLVSTFDAADGLKNLLARGFDLQQAVTVLNRLGEAAAFGRASHLSLSEAIRTAAEGLRQERSELVDNAGVQRNVAQLWADYAKELGVATTQLTLAQKIQAEYLGILRETEPMVGDIARLTETGAGAQAQFAAQLERTRAGIGLMLQEAGGPFLQVLGGIVEAFNNAPPVIQRFVTAITIAATSLAILRKAVIALEISMGPGGWLIAGVSILATTFGLLESAAKDAGDELGDVEKELGKVVDKRADLERFKALGALPGVTRDLEDAKKGYEDLLKTLRNSNVEAQKVAKSTQDVVNNLGFERASSRVNQRIESLTGGLNKYIQKWEQVNAVLEGAGKQQVGILEYVQSLQNDAIKAQDVQEVNILSNVILRVREIEALRQVEQQITRIVEKEKELETTRKISEGVFQQTKQVTEDTNAALEGSADKQKDITDEKIKDLDRLMDYNFQTNRLTLANYIEYLEGRLSGTKRETAAEILEWTRLFDQIQALKQQAQEEATLQFRIESPAFPEVAAPEGIAGQAPQGFGQEFFRSGEEYLAMIRQIQFEVLNLSGALQFALVQQWINGISAAKAFEAAVKQIIANIVARLASNAIIFGLLSLIPGFGQALGLGSFSKFLFSGFARGGYTGAGAENEMAGVVHRGEFVFPKTITERFRPLFELILKNPQGFQGGGFVGGDPQKVIEKEKKRVDSIAISKTLIERYKPLFKVIMSAGKGFQQGGFVDPGTGRKPDDLIPVPLRVVEKYKSFFSLVMGNVQPEVQRQEPLAAVGQRQEAAAVGRERQQQLAGSVSREPQQPGQRIAVNIRESIQRIKPVLNVISGAATTPQIQPEQGQLSASGTGEALQPVVNIRESIQKIKPVFETISSQVRRVSETQREVERSMAIEKQPGQFVMIPKMFVERYKPVFDLIKGRERGFQSGGFTGMGSISDVAGIVHRGEFVFPANITKRYRGIFEMILGRFRGYQQGGFVQQFAPPPVPALQTLQVVVKPGEFTIEGRTLKTLVDVETVLDKNRLL